MSAIKGLTIIPHSQLEGVSGVEPTGRVGSASLGLIRNSTATPVNTEVIVVARNIPEQHDTCGVPLSTRHQMVHYRSSLIRCQSTLF